MENKRKHERTGVMSSLGVSVITIKLYIRIRVTIKEMIARNGYPALNEAANESAERDIMP